MSSTVLWRNTQSCSRPQTLRFGTAGFMCTNTVVSYQWPWDRVRSVTEGKEFVMLRLDSVGSGAVVPRRAFTEEQLAAFLAYAKQARPPR